MMHCLRYESSVPYTQYSNSTTREIAETAYRLLDHTFEGRRVSLDIPHTKVGGYELTRPRTMTSQLYSNEVEVDGVDTYV